MLVRVNHIVGKELIRGRNASCCQRIAVGVVGEDHQTGVEVQEKHRNQPNNGEAQSDLGQTEGFQGHALLNRGLVGAKQGCPVEEAPNDHRPHCVTGCRTGIHAEKDNINLKHESCCKIFPLT